MNKVETQLNSPLKRYIVQHAVVHKNLVFKVRAAGHDYYITTNKFSSVIDGCAAIASIRFIHSAAQKAAVARAVN